MHAGRLPPRSSHVRIPHCCSSAPELQSVRVALPQRLRSWRAAHSRPSLTLPSPSPASHPCSAQEASTPRSSSAASVDSALGWTRYCPPECQVGGAARAAPFRMWPGPPLGGCLLTAVGAAVGHACGPTVCAQVPCRRRWSAGWPANACRARRALRAPHPHRRCGGTRRRACCRSSRRRRPAWRGPGCSAGRWPTEAAEPVAAAGCTRHTPPAHASAAAAHVQM